MPTTKKQTNEYMRIKKSECFCNIVILTLGSGGAGVDGEGTDMETGGSLEASQSMSYGFSERYYVKKLSVLTSLAEAGL